MVEALCKRHMSYFSPWRKFSLSLSGEFSFIFAALSSSVFGEKRERNGNESFSEKEKVDGKADYAY